MDLALAFGIPCRELAARLSEGEFQDWQVYASKKTLPHRRMEIYMAQLCHLFASFAGVKDKTALDYLLFDEPEEMSAEEAFGFSPRNR